MTKEEILKKSIEKAVKDGWVPTFIPDYKNLTISGRFILSSPEGLILTCINTILFSHDFAKAFFGERKLYAPDAQDWDYDKNPNPPDNEYFGDITWQYHLQQMVLKEDPINYLTKFL